MNKSFFEHLKSELMHLVFSFGPKLIFAILTFIVGVFLIKLIRSIILRLLKKTNVDLSVQTFMRSFSTVFLWAVLFFIIGLILGIKASLFITIFGAAGLAIGLALQGSLSNFAGGLLILIFKPFKIGDEVIIGEAEGYVEDINMLYTHVNNWRGEMYSIPNGSVSNNMVKNNSAEKHRRVQLELRFKLDQDIDELREVITNAMKKHPRTIDSKPFQLRVRGFEDYYIKTSCRCWCKTEEFWEVYWSVEELVKKALDEKGIQLAIPEKMVHQAKPAE